MDDRRSNLVPSFTYGNHSQSRSASLRPQPSYQPPPSSYQPPQQYQSPHNTSRPPDGGGGWNTIVEYRSASPVRTVGSGGGGGSGGRAPSQMYGGQSPRPAPGPTSSRLGYEDGRVAQAPMGLPPRPETPGRRASPLEVRPGMERDGDAQSSSLAYRPVGTAGGDPRMSEAAGRLQPYGVPQSFDRSGPPRAVTFADDNNSSNSRPEATMRPQMAPTLPPLVPEGIAPYDDDHGNGQGSSSVSRTQGSRSFATAVPQQPQQQLAALPPQPHHQHEATNSTAHNTSTASTTDHLPYRLNDSQREAQSREYARWVSRQHADPQLNHSTSVSQQSLSRTGMDDTTNGAETVDDNGTHSLWNQLQDRTLEVLKLRASLMASYRGFAERFTVVHTRQGARLIEAITAATADGHADGEDDPDLLVDGAPPHVEGLPALPLPLDIPSTFGQVFGYLDMLETDEKRFFKRAWKTRFVVADDRGVTVFREDVDFRQLAFHKALLYAPYRAMDYFVPSFQEAARTLAVDGGPADLCSQVKAVTEQYSQDLRYKCFGFVSKQPTAGDAHRNPEVIFRTTSPQQHSDWAHFLSKAFNRRMYKELFPMMLPEDFFGYLCKEVQATPVVASTEVQADAHEALVIENEAGEREVVERFHDASCMTDVAAIRTEACQTVDVAEYITDSTNPSPSLRSDESVAFQLHIQSLQQRILSLEENAMALRQERDDAQDHAAILQKTIGILEGETKRLRTSVLEAHEKNMKMMSDTESREKDIRDEEVTKLKKQLAELETKHQEDQAAAQATEKELQEALISYQKKLSDLAGKAVTDIDTLYDEYHKVNFQLNVQPRVEPSGMLREGSPRRLEEPEHHDVEGLYSLGLLNVLSSAEGDVQFRLTVRDALCTIERTTEDILCKSWFLTNHFSSDGVTLSVELTRGDDDEEEEELESITERTVSDLYEEEPRILTPPPPPRYTRPVHLLHDSRYDCVRAEPSSILLNRLKRRIPASLAGRVALPKQPFRVV